MMKALIFDLGGVVVEWSNEVTYRFIEERYGIAANEFKRESEKGMPRVQTGEVPEEDWMINTFRLFGEPPEGCKEVWGMTFEAARYNDKVLKIIERVRRSDIKVVALSNLEPSRARWLNRHGIDSIFDAVIFSCEVGARKPDARADIKDLSIYRLALNRLGLEAEDCVFVDDNVNCVSAAELTGMKTILYKDAGELSKELHKMGLL